jgi:hypothetical protein
VGRLLRGTFKLAIIGAVIGGAAFAAKKLMGGFGPAPGSADAPREWPSLVPEPTAPAPGSTAGSNGAEPAPATPAASDTDAAAPIIDEVPFTPAPAPAPETGLVDPAPETGAGEGTPTI